MKHSVDLREKWKSFVWPSMQWCREVLVRLFESGFKGPLHASLIEKVRYLQHAIRVSLPSERGGNKLRIRERAKMNKRCGDVDQWHTLFTSLLWRNTSDHMCKSHLLQNVSDRRHSKPFHSSFENIILQTVLAFLGS